MENKEEPKSSNTTETLNPSPLPNGTSPNTDNHPQESSNSTETTETINQAPSQNDSTPNTDNHHQESSNSTETTETTSQAPLPIDSTPNTDNQNSTTEIKNNIEPNISEEKTSNEEIPTKIIESNDMVIIDHSANNNSLLAKLELPPEFISDKERCNILTQKLVKKTSKNANMKLEDFFSKNRHFLIMTDGGKPVYSRYGDAVENNSIFATISAMITKFTIFNSNESFKEELNVISNNKNKIVFLKKGQLIFIALTKKNDCVSLLQSQLEMIYNQLMSILTIRFYEKLEDNPSKCLTAMSGTENLFEQIIQYSSHSFISLFNSYQIMNFVNFSENREKISKILEENRGDALYCILMTPYEIISLTHSNQIVVSSIDLILIQTLIYSTEMLRSQESYVPICLPGISEQGYLQVYSNFSEENIGVIFVTENMDPMCFMSFQKQYNNLYNALIKNNFVKKIVKNMLLNNNTKGINSIMKNKNDLEKKSDEDLINALFNKIQIINGNIPINDNPLMMNNQELSKTRTLSVSTNNVNSFVFKNIYEEIKYGVIYNKKYCQYFMLNFGMDFRTYKKSEKNIIRRFNILFDIYNNCKDKEKEYFYAEKSNGCCNCIFANEFFILICSFDFFSDVEDLSKKCREILKYCKKNENKLFITHK